ncbi:MAG: amidohydrolase family protein [Planctomycetes bacterium]|nr:amidohydrolase family protein [Planctomycetota bacterium]
MASLLVTAAVAFVAPAFFFDSLIESASIPAPFSADEIQGPQDGTFLIEGVRIWKNGRVGNAQDLLIQNGWIAAIGVDAVNSAPPTARRIEAEDDWIIYPGLIHADMGVTFESAPSNPYAVEATDPRTGPVTHMELDTTQNLRAWLYAADLLDWDADIGEDWRRSGFTSAHVIPSERGLLRGRTAAVSLNDRPLGQALLMRDGFQTYSLRGAGGGYPGTPMASLAMLRQVFIDAQLAGSGEIRRASDSTHGNLGPAIFLANGRREIENFLDLHAEFAPDLPAMILGGQDARYFTNRLQAQNIGVLYVAGFGEAPKSDEDLDIKSAGDRPYWQDPTALREQKRSMHSLAVAEFSDLHASGVRCALVPGRSVSDWKDAWEQLTEAGLDTSHIWQAASAGAADMLGMENVASVEVGYAADLVIYAGEPSPESTPQWIFVDGRGWNFQIEEEEESSDSEEDADDPEGAGTSTVDGIWKITVQTPVGEEQFYAVVNREKESIRVTDSLDSPTDPGKDVGFQDSRIKFTYYVEEMQMEFTLFGQVEGDSMTAKMTTDFGDVPAVGRRIEEVDGEEMQEVADEQIPSSEEKDDSEDKKESSGVAKGHPEWLVETEEDRKPTNPYSGSVMIQNGTIYTVAGDDPFVGSLLIEDGKITAVSSGYLSPPDGVPVYDAAGKHVTPAMLDAHSHLALASINEGSMTITAEVRIGDMIITRDYGIYRAAAGGTAMVQSLHGSANPIGGQAVVWEMDYHANRMDEVRYPAKQGIKFALGENVKQSNWNNSGNRFPNSRMGVQAVYRRAFQAAQDYSAQRVQADAGLLPGFRRDVRLEVLADIIENKIHIQCHSYRADELQMFLNVCQEFGIEKPTFQHVLEGYKVAPELAEYGAMGSSFADWWAYKIEAYDAVPYNPAMMHDAGMVSSINSDSDDLIRRLNTEAGKSLRYSDLYWEDAMSFATKNVATQLWIDEFVGTLEPGKDGTVAVWDADPLSTYARCYLTLARGKTLFEWKPSNDENWENYANAVANFSVSIADRGTAAESQFDGGPEEWEAWTHLGHGEHYLIDNVHIHSMAEAPSAGGDFKSKGWVEVKDGRFVRVGSGRFRAQRPTGATMVDGRGMDLYPGFINGTDATGLYEIGSVRGTDDRRETGSDHPDLSIASAIHADSAHHDVTRMHGITHVYVRPGYGRIMGQGAMIQLEGDVTDEMVVSKDHGLVIRFPRARAPRLGQIGQAEDLHEHDCLAAGKEDHEYVLDLGGVHQDGHEHEHQDEGVDELVFDPREGVQMPDSIDELDKWFDDALEYGEEMDRLAAAGASPIVRNVKLAALVPYARGDKSVLIEANDAITIMAARAWGKDRGLNVIYLGAKEAWKVAGYLGADKARVILGSVMDLPSRRNDPYDANWRGAMVLKVAGCEVALRTDNPEVSRNLPFQAAAASAWGLGRDATLRALTIDAARILGVEQFTGSIEVGKSANFFLASGDPLDFTGSVQRMWIGGREVSLTNRQTELRDRYQKRIDSANESKSGFWKR